MFSVVKFLRQAYSHQSSGRSEPSRVAPHSVSIASNRGSRHQEGSTLIVVVLMVLVLMAGMIVVSANLSISGRRSTADQRVTLQAQYAADSGAGLARARLTAFNALFDAASVPVTVIRSTMEAQVAVLCGMSPALLPNPTGSDYYTLDTDDSLFRVRGVLPPVPQRLRGALVCKPGSFSSDTNFSLFNSYIPESAFVASGLTTAADRNAFWVRMFGGIGAASESVGSTNLQFTFVPLAVTRVEWDAFRVYFTMADELRSVGSASGAGTARVVSIRNQPDVYYVEFSRPSFAKYALFTNHHFSDANDERSGNMLWFTNTTQFSGPVHTNQNFNYYNNPWFGGVGNVTSAGCPVGQIISVNGQPDRCGAASVAGARFYSRSQSAIISATDRTVFADPNRPSSGNDRPTIVNRPKWDEDFIPLPENANDQATEALAGEPSSGGGKGSSNLAGLYLNGNISDFNLKVDTDAGVKYQYITYTQGSTTTQLRFDESGNVMIYDSRKVGSTTVGWTSARYVTGNIGASWQPPVTATLIRPAADPHKFNGVIYINGGVDSLRGPSRQTAAGADSTTVTTSTDTPRTAGYTPPSVASFAKMTIASKNTINVASDLKYEVRPCTSGSAQTAQCSTDSNGDFIENILGIYSQEGDIQIANSGSATSSRTNAPNNVQIDAVMMSSKGAVRVQNYNGGSSRGSLNLQGGIIENYYGAFGTFNSGTGVQSTGFGRNFVYDPRMATGYAPPAFPTQRQWKVGVKAMTGSDVDLQLKGEWRQVGAP